MKLINYIKKRPFDAAVWGMILLGLLVAAYFTFIIFLSDDIGAKYGNRLDNIKSYQIVKENIVTKMNTGKSVVKTEVNVVGKTVNIMTYTSAKPTKKMVDEIGALAQTAISADNKSFYDVQLFIAENSYEVNNSAPVIGYMKAGNDHFSWTYNKGSLS